MKKSNFTFSIFTLLVFIGMTVSIEAQERKASEQQTVISQEQFESASPERQAYIKENPQLYKVVDKPTSDVQQQQRPVRQRQTEYETKTLEDGTTIVYLTQEQFEALPPARQQIVKDNPEKFIIADEEDRESRPE